MFSNRSAVTLKRKRLLPYTHLKQEFQYSTVLWHSPSSNVSSGRQVLWQNWHRHESI